MPKPKNPYHAVPNQQRLDRVRDLHHRWWRRRNYRTVTEKTFLGLGCTRDSNLDVLVHGIVHAFGYREPHKPSATQMDWMVERHREGQCGCFYPELLVPVNILFVARNQDDAAQQALPQCTFTLWDVEVLELAEQLYVPRRPQAVSRREVRRIEARHALQVCGCYQDGRLVRKQQQVAQLLTA